MATLQDVEEFIKDHAEDCDSGCPASPELILEAEQFLGVRFPDDYRAFLARWGTLAVGPLEFYGVCNRNFVDSSVPDAIWFTARQRAEVELPRELVVIADDNGVEYFCLSTTDPADSRVLIWNNVTRQIRGVRSDSLFNFILGESADVV